MITKNYFMLLSTASLMIVSCNAMEQSSFTIPDLIRLRINRLERTINEYRAMNEDDFDRIIRGKTPSDPPTVMQNDGVTPQMIYIQRYQKERARLLNILSSLT